MSNAQRTLAPAHSTITLTFQDTNINAIEQHDQQWLTAADISRALGYKTDDSVTRIYNRNQDEFDDSTTKTVNLTVQGQERKTRIFNKRGCQLIALLSRTQKAKAFRAWVLDVLETNTTTPSNSMELTPAAPPQHTLPTTQTTGDIINHMIDALQGSDTDNTLTIKLQPDGNHTIRHLTGKVGVFPHHAVKAFIDHYERQTEISVKNSNAVIEFIASSSNIEEGFK